MRRPRFTTLHPEGGFNTSKDIVDRLLLDNMKDEEFILESTRSLDPETRAAVREALDQMAQHSRHIGQRLIDVLRVRTTRSTPGRNGQVISARVSPSASQTRETWTDERQPGPKIKNEFHAQAGVHHRPRRGQCRAAS